jgi:SAM-dependent methyltransferase
MGASEFDVDGMGAAYVRGRPYHHRDALDRICDLVGEGHVARAVDVACGTGMSTIALAERADLVLGLDVAVSMLAAAPHHPRADFALAAAEALPLRDRCVDALTISSGLHWLDRDRFFDEVRRVVRPGGWAAAYEHALAGDPAHGPAFGAWLRDEYWPRYPVPHRGPMLRVEVPEPEGLVLLGHSSWTDLFPLTHEAIVDHLATYSGAVVAVSSGRETDAELRAWLADGTRVWFGDRGQVAVAFRGTAAAWRVGDGGDATGS